MDSEIKGWEIYIVESDLLLKKTKKNFLDCLDFFSEEWRRIWPVSFSINLHEMLLKLLLAVFFKEALLKFLPKMLPRETLCKMIQIFPPKVLVYIRKIVIDSIENYLINQLIIKENMKLLWITECILRDNKSWHKNR